MAAPVNGQEFFALLEKSQLLDEEVISKLRPQMEKHQQTEPKRLATTLLKNQLITEYHARQLLVGKYKGFYLARYKLMELLGVGGMGRVYLAEQVSMERLVAIKLISLQKNKKHHAQALARFKREAKAVAALRHPNIIQAFDFADEHGMPYIVMEYIEGMDTARIVHKFGPIPWRQAAEYGRQAAEGLHHAHQAGLVHRDVKPGNLLVDSSGQVKILDLGLVSAFDQKADDSLTVDQDQLGTVDYIAPEQALDSKSVDARADIYSLGATLYSVMTGRILFPDKTTAQKLLMHQTTDPEAITNLVKDIPAELAAIIGRMLAKKPDQRYQTALEVSHALKKFAEPKSPPYELNAIKYRRAVYEGFLGKSPEPNQITVPTLGSPEVEKPTATPREGASQMSGKLRQASMINAASSDPHLDEFAMPGDDYTQLAMEMPSLAGRKKKKKSKKKPGLEPLQIVAVAGSILGLLLAAWLGSNAIRAMGKEDDALNSQFNNSTYLPPLTSPAPAPSGGGPQNPVDQSQYQAIDLSSVANTTTTKGMFNDEANLTETLIFDQWGPKTFDNVTFTLIDPQGNLKPNALMLHGTMGTQPPLKPRSVQVPLNTSAKAIHLLSGVGGYCFPMTPDPFTVMVARLKYADGQTEDHRLLNGTHFADYIQRTDVSGSTYAFDLHQKQLRYLRIIPQQAKVIESIEFVKDSDNATAPIVLAMTVQRLDGGPASIAGAPAQPRHVPSTDLTSRPILMSKETVPEQTWRDSLAKMQADPELLVNYTFDETSITGETVKNQAKGTPGQFNLKLVGPKVSAGRFPGKKSLRFNPAGTGQRAEISATDSELLQLEGPFTVAVWFKVDKFDKPWQTLIAKGDSGWRLHRCLDSNRLGLHVTVADQAIYELNGSYVTNDARWHQVVGVNSPQSNSMRIYMDGYLDIEMPWTAPANHNRFPVWIGQTSETEKGDRGFDGWIDEVSLWKRDLDALEIKRLFNLGNPAQ